MNHISLLQHQPVFSRAPCAWIAIDGVPVEHWFAAQSDNPDAITLGFAPMWLHNPEEEELAWSRLVPGEENSSTVVPILVCSDDMDLHCTVVVVEQLVTSDTVQWVRWGYSSSIGVEVGISTRWGQATSTPLALFDRAEFDTCVRTFGRN